MGKNKQSLRSDALKQSLRANALKKSANLQFAAFFFILLGGIIFLSLTFRVFFLLKESKFDGSSHFTLQLNRQNEVQYLSFSPRDSSIGILSFKDTHPPSEIPVDARTNSVTTFNKTNVKSSLFKMLFDFPNQKEINFVDISRLLFFSQTVKDGDFLEKQISIKTDKIEVNSVISSFFLDPQIQDEKLNVQVINSTDVYGLGNKFANLISNAGGNVILVSTGDLKKESKIEYFNSSYTVEKLSKLLKFKKVKIAKKALGDVTVIIGYNYVR